MSGVGPARIHTAQPFTNQVAIPTGSNSISIDQREALGIDGSSEHAPLGEAHGNDDLCQKTFP